MLVTTHLFENIYDGKLRKRAETYIVKDSKLLVAIGTKSGNPSLPGGKIEKGETAKTAAERETLEEVGIKINLIKPLKPYSFSYVKEIGPWETLPKEITRWKELGMETYPFIAEYVKKDNTLFNSEGDGKSYKWMSSKEAITAFKNLEKKDEYFKIRCPYIINIIKQLKNEKFIK